MASAQRPHVNSVFFENTQLVRPAGTAGNLRAEGHSAYAPQDVPAPDQMNATASGIELAIE